MINMSELKDIAKDFIDNSGNATCDYCSGKGLSSSSDQPSKAIV
jgi:hypothetical protein